MSDPDDPAVAPGAPRKAAGIAARGVLMGLAEVVPGVSGGTIAFITGIYQELVAALAAFGPASLPMLARPSTFYAHHNLRFLLSLGLGMAAGVVLFAQLMHWLISHYQPLVWAFFSGVIAASVVVIGRLRAPRALLYWAPFGLLSGLALLWLPVVAGDGGSFEIFFGAALAVCAWLLPAVSGSYVLLTLGLYNQVINAVATLDWPVLLTVMAGCAGGLLLFSRFLAWLLRRHYEAVLSYLTGFMLGSMPKLWPWQDAAGAGMARLLSPAAYAQMLEMPAQPFTAGVMFAVGCFALWSMTRLTPA